MSRARIFFTTFAVFSIVVGIAQPTNTLGQCTDHDGDGYGAVITDSCPNGIEQDCNDASPTTHPNAPEVCDGYDNDCDGTLDNPSNCAIECDLQITRSGIELSKDPTDPEVPRLVWNGREFATVWQDGIDSQEELYFARLNASGKRIGRVIRLTNAPEKSVSPSMVWNGTEYGLAWKDNRAGSDVYFSRLDRFGKELGEVTKVTNVQFFEPVSPMLVWSGSEYGLIWIENPNRTATVVYFARIATDGSRIGPTVAVSPTTTYAWPGALVWTGSEYGVTYTDKRNGNKDVYFSRLDRSGSKLGPDVQVTFNAGEDRAPTLVWADTAYGILWTRWNDPLNRQILFLRLDQFGNVTGSELAVTTSSGISRVGGIAWTGSHYALTWSDSRDGPLDLNAFFRLADAQGSLMGSDVRLTNTGLPSLDPIPVWTGDGFGVVWFEEESRALFTRLGCPM